MSGITKFHATDELLEARKEAHDALDIFWKAHNIKRVSVYRWMHNSLGPEFPEHISDMNRDQCNAVIRLVQNTLERSGIFQCRSCKNVLVKKNTAMLGCSVRGSFFNSRTLHRCNDFKEKENELLRK